MSGANNGPERLTFHHPSPPLRQKKKTPSTSVPTTSRPTHIHTHDKTPSSPLGVSDEITVATESIPFFEGQSRPNIDTLPARVLLPVFLSGVLLRFAVQVKVSGLSMRGGREREISVLGIGMIRRVGRGRIKGMGGTKNTAVSFHRVSRFSRSLCESERKTWTKPKGEPGALVWKKGV